MAQLMTLSTPTRQEDFTEFVFSDLPCSPSHSSGTDFSCPGDHTMSPTTDTRNRSLRSGEDVSEVAERSEDQVQKPANEIRGRVKHGPESVSQDCTDASLVEQAASGNERAFEQLVQRYERLVSQFVSRRLLYTEDAQDVVQFVFLQLYLYLPRLQGRLVFTRSQQPLKSWLFQVARNRCLDEHSKKHLFLFSDLPAVSEEESSPFEDLPDTAPFPEEVVEQQEQQLLLQGAIQTLPSKLRAIVSLRYREDLTFREIGCRLHIPENTAKTYFQRARPLLRTALACLDFDTNHDVENSHKPGKIASCGENLCMG